MYRATGRVMQQRPELFTDLDWFWIFEGMGVTPRDYDPLVDTVDFEQVKRLMLAISQKIAADAAAAPTHDSFFAMANAKARRGTQGCRRGAIHRLTCRPPQTTCRRRIGRHQVRMHSRHRPRRCPRGGAAAYRRSRRNTAADRSGSRPLARSARPGARIGHCLVWSHRPARGICDLRIHHVHPQSRLAQHRRGAGDWGAEAACRSVSIPM